MVGLRPMPGTMFASMEIEEGERKGLIYLPSSIRARNRVTFTGVGVAENPVPGGMRLTVGKRLLFAGWAGARFTWQGQDYVKYHLILSEILAVWYEGEWVDLLAPETGRDNSPSLPGETVERCRWCRTSGQGNMLTDGDGYCIRCKRDSTGKKRPVYRYRTSDGQTHERDNPIGKTPLPSGSDESIDEETRRRIARQLET